MIRSSYIQYNYGEVLKDIVIRTSPVCLVELGVLDGYSALHIAQGLKDSDSKSVLHAYDLFEDYQYKHGIKEDVEKMLADNDVAEHVILAKGDAYKVYDDYFNEEVDFLHIDISNTGKIVHDLIWLWNTKMSRRATIVIEGGSQERDEIEWMRKYDATPIKTELETNSIIKEFYSYKTYTEFPSMTVLTRKP